MNNKRWISITDKLPRPNSTILVACTNRLQGTAYGMLRINSKGIPVLPFVILYNAFGITIEKSYNFQYWLPLAGLSPCDSCEFQNTDLSDKAMDDHYFYYSHGADSNFDEVDVQYALAKLFKEAAQESIKLSNDKTAKETNYSSFWIADGENIKKNIDSVDIKETIKE